MGTACACGHSNSFMTTYQEYWNGIKIRTTPANDWALTIKSKAKPANNTLLAEKIFSSIIRNNLSSIDGDQELSAKIFSEAMKQAESASGQYLLIMSAVFLCENNNSGAKQAFIDLSDVLCKFTTQGFLKKDAGVYYISKDKLYQIVCFYVNLVSLHCADKLFANSSNSKDVEELVSVVFSTNNQKKFIYDKIFKNFDFFEFVDLDKFFHDTYAILNDDNKIREGIKTIYEAENAHKTK